MKFSAFWTKFITLSSVMFTAVKEYHGGNSFFLAFYSRTFSHFQFPKKDNQNRDEQRKPYEVSVFDILNAKLQMIVSF
jgi:hypothetical protein